MRSPILVLLAPVLLLGCSQLSSTDTLPAEAEALTGLDLNAAKYDARKFLGESFELFAICGASKGVSIYLGDENYKFETVQFTEGVIAFGIAKDGSLNVVQRGASKKMVSVSESEYAVEITRTKAVGDERQGIWTIRYLAYGLGIVETHNLTVREDGQLYDLWTSSKPKNPMEAWATLSVSKCDFL